MKNQKLPANIKYTLNLSDLIFSSLYKISNDVQINLRLKRFFNIYVAFLFFLGLIFVLFDLYFFSIVSFVSLFAGILFWSKNVRYGYYNRALKKNKEYFEENEENFKNEMSIEFFEEEMEIILFDKRKFRRTYNSVTSIIMIKKIIILDLNNFDIIIPIKQIDDIDFLLTNILGSIRNKIKFDLDWEWNKWNGGSFF